MKKRWKYWVIGAVIAVGATVGAHLLNNQPLFRQISAKAYDAHFVLRGKQPTSDIVLVTADQKALNAFPELLAFWHPYYADAIRGAQAGGAKVIAMDVAFGVPVDRWVPENDQILGEAVATSQVPVVVGFIPALVERQRERPIPINMIASMLNLAGYANLTADPDDFIRRQELIEAPSQGGAPDEPLARSFAMKIAERATGSEAKLEGGRLTLGGKAIPISADRAIPINFAGPADTFPRISLADFVEAARAKNEKQLKEWVSGKLVLIGPDALDDRYPTPFYTVAQASKWTTAGVEIHANTLRTILTQAYILPAPQWLETGGLVLMGFLMFWSATALGTRLVAASAVGILGLALAGSHLLFLSRFTMADSGIAGCWLLSLVASIGYRFVSAENRRDLFRKAVTMFVGKQVTETLEQADGVGRSGKREEVTILFTDIRGFTAFCEDKDPSYVVDLLNQYLTQMVAIIVKHGGHVNKFIGDGILAIFSNDEGQTPGDHPRRAVLCAIEMVSAPNQFKTGAGLHSGPAVVGNIGSEDKMEYTVLGDTVNLASRLESLNKENKTRLLMSGSTRAAMGDDIEVTKLGAVPVRGKTEPVEIFTVTAVYDHAAAQHATGKEAK